MADAANVTVEEVRRVADLANLQLSVDDEIRMQRDLNAILVHVAQLNELDTSHVEAMAQVTEILNLPPLPPIATLRADATRPSLDRKLVLECAPDSDGAFFKVPKVMDR